MDSAPNAIRVAAITVSDSRTQATDEGGARLRERLEAHGFSVSFSALVPDEPGEIVAILARVCREDLADAVVYTGGTGIAPRDQTYEALAPLIEKRLDGFSEAFRRLSWDEIGPKAILSRALAGSHQGRLVVALPGSPKAVVLGVDRVLAPVLAHAIGLLRPGRGRH
jgi:molybdenum cofactor biosynthesis protein B